MKLVKKINNNFALGVDRDNETVIVEGKGIGFNKMPCEITDLSKITRTYYDIDEQNVEGIVDVPLEIVDVANKIYYYAMGRLDDNVNPNLPFILADHIHFAIKRHQENINVNLPIYYDVKHLYPTEFRIGEYALSLIEKELKITLGQEEKVGIALNIINSSINNEQSDYNNRFSKWIKQITDIIEQEMDVSIEKDSFNYSRFVKHAQYLFKKIETNEVLTSDNATMYRSLVEGFPKTSLCVDKIAEFVKEEENIQLADEEKLYLILHVNRLCNREKGL